MKKLFSLILFAGALLFSASSFATRKFLVVIIDGTVVTADCVLTDGSCLDNVIIRPQE